jgi:hypothetical protein
MIEKARNLGILARQESRPRVPLWDSSLRDMLVEVPDKVFTLACRAWLEGWDSENLQIAANNRLIIQL